MKITFFGHFGSANSGNESTLVAILARLRYLSPACDFSCICTNPNSVMARDGIAAVPISTRVLRIRNSEARLGRRLGVAFLAMTQELWQYVRAFRTLKGTDVLIIPGTGLLNDAYGLSAYGLSAWGPYNMFKWSLMAKLRGCKIAFVSVGAGPIDGALGRFLVKSALSFATYRSYRDDSSLHFLTSIGVDTTQDRVYPDLAFSLPETSMPPSETRIRQRNRVVGLGLMLYPGKYSVANPRDDTHASYLEALVGFAEWLLASGYDIKLLLGDDDTHVIEEFKSLLEARVGFDVEERVAYEPITSVHEILPQLAATDIVVATRFHNVLLSFLLNKPVIAISFHHKCTSLMSQMGMSAYCQDIHRLNAESLVAQFQELERNTEAVKRIIRQRVEDSREALDEQYDLVLNL